MSNILSSNPTLLCKLCHTLPSLGEKYQNFLHFCTKPFNRLFTLSNISPKTIVYNFNLLVWYQYQYLATNIYKFYPSATNIGRFLFHQRAFKTWKLIIFCLLHQGINKQIGSLVKLVYLPVFVNVTWPATLLKISLFHMFNSSQYQPFVSDEIDYLQIRMLYTTFENRMFVYFHLIIVMSNGKIQSVLQQKFLVYDRAFRTTISVYNHLQLLFIRRNLLFSK